MNENSKTPGPISNFIEFMGNDPDLRSKLPPILPSCTRKEIKYEPIRTKGWNKIMNEKLKILGPYTGEEIKKSLTLTAGGWRRVVDGKIYSLYDGEVRGIRNDKKYCLLVDDAERILTLYIDNSKPEREVK